MHSSEYILKNSMLEICIYLVYNIYDAIAFLSARFILVAKVSFK